MLYKATCHSTLIPNENKELYCIWHTALFKPLDYLVYITFRHAIFFRQKTNNISHFFIISEHSAIFFIQFYISSIA